MPSFKTISSRLAMSVITLFIGALLLSLTACSTQKITDLSTRKPVMSLEAFFEGQTIAYGIFEDYSQSLSRQFRVNITGTVNGNLLTLEEDFLYDDGENQRRVWKITNLGTDDSGIIQYEGVADDVVGKAAGQFTGNALNWRYTLALPVDGSVYHIEFDDWIYQQDQYVALNRARLSKFGIEVGSVTLAFVRGAAAETIGPLDLENW